MKFLSTLYSIEVALYRQLMKKVNSSGDDWDLHLNEALLEIRIRPAARTGVPPFELHHNFAFRMNSRFERSDEEDDIVQLLGEDDDKAEMELEHRLQSACDETLEAYRRAREEIYTGIAESIDKEAARQKGSFDHHALGRGEKLEVGTSNE